MTRIELATLAYLRERTYFHTAYKYYALPIELHDLFMFYKMTIQTIFFKRK